MRLKHPHLPHPAMAQCQSRSHTHLHIQTDAVPEHPAIRILAPPRPGEPATQHPDGAAPPRTCAPPELVAAAPASLSAGTPPAPLAVRPHRRPFPRRPAPPPTVPTRGGHQCEVKPVGASIFGSSL